MTRPPFVMPLPEDGGARPAPRPEVMELDTVSAVPVDEAAPAEAAAATEAALAPRRRWGAIALRLGLAALAGLVAIAIGDWAVGLAEGLLAEGSWFAWPATVLAVLAGIGFGLWILWEILSLRRLGRVDDIRSHARAAAGGDRTAAARTIEAMRTLRGGDPTLFRRIDAEEDAVRDPAELLALLEATVQRPSDAACRLAIAAAARRTALITAVSPFVILDMVATMAINLRMIRRIAEIQAGRPGLLATLALIRRTLAALLVAGGVEAMDDYIGAFAGSGLVRSLGKRAGEGAINGLMTIRIGIAAARVCRPLPYLREAPPSMLTVGRDVFR